MQRSHLPWTFCLLAACAGEDACSTEGDLGRARFSYMSGHGCGFGCNMDKGMATGTTERIAVRAEGDVDLLNPEMGDPSIARITTSTQSFSCQTSSEGMTTVEGCRDGSSCKMDCDAKNGTFRASLDVGVSAVAEGETELFVRGPDGVFDKIELRVRPLADIGLEAVRQVRGETETGMFRDGDSFGVEIGTTAILSGVAFDEGGDELHATTLLTVTAEGSGTVEVISTLLATPDSVSVDAKMLGQFSATVSAPGKTLRTHGTVHTR